MGFKNSQQLMEYWEIRVKEFEKELSEYFPQMSSEEQEEECVIGAKRFIADKRHYSNRLPELFNVEGRFKKPNEVDRIFDREYYPEFYSFLSDIDIMVHG